MQGGSLGVLVSGWVDVHQQDLELSGTVVPLNKLNKLVGKIPVFGKAVVGKDSHGIMAVDYMVTGTVSDPVPSIRKKSMTPEILKKTLGDNEESLLPDFW